MEDTIDLDAMKLRLLNVVSASLIQAPKFDNPNDQTAILIRGLVSEMAQIDPEFVLKLALYVRDDLNIRSTANYMLALASFLEPCRPFLAKYFDKTIRLPSDWLDVVALYHSLPEAGSGLPTALRKALVARFPSFDAYQLGKYNREGKIKRAAKKAKKEQERNKERGGREVDVPKRKPVTMKQMIQLLHISVPPFFVMCILGRKYPATEREYANSGLTGPFDPEKAGKRMKLPVPETWETLLSARGNSANTWEQLIDHRKLPFMAMLRNLRNLILAGISPAHHKWVISRLRDENTVANSRQFPFAFFSAYEALNIDLDELKREVDEEKERILAKKNGSSGARGRGDGAGRGGRGRGRGGLRQSGGGGEQYPRKKVRIPKVFPTPALLQKYRDALDTSVKLATVYNVKPIRGSTVVFCDVSSAMNADCRAARMGAPRSLADVGILLGLMCKYMCEECDFRIFAGMSGGRSHVPVDLIDGTILDNMAVVKESVCQLASDTWHFPEDYFVSLIRDRKKIDQIIVLSNEAIIPGTHNSRNVDIENLLVKYRQEVNPDLLYVSVNLSGRGGVASKEAKHPNDVTIAGFSDAILRYVAERGDGTMLSYIQHIDDIKNLNKVKPRRALSMTQRRKNANPKWESSGLWSWMDPVQLCQHGGCTKKVKKLKLEAHMKTCSYRPVCCQFQGCNMTIPFREVDEHAAVCPFNRIQQLKTARHRTARVFVSSTFLDMHGEREVLVKKVFPELRERCKARRINFFEVDFRWGVTEEDVSSGTIGHILPEIDRCRPFFLGMIGKRYGWVPDSYKVTEATEQDFGWLESYPAKRSITELEMHYGFLTAPENSRALFYIRQDNIEVDPKHASLFESENEHATERIADLKQRVRETCASTGRRCLYDGYPATWGGVQDGKAMMTGLELFGERVLEDLWREICDVFPVDNRPPPTPLELEGEKHDDFKLLNSRTFVGRNEELAQLYAFADGSEDGPLVVHGPSGIGKSALLAAFCKRYSKDRPGVFVLPHFVSASSTSSDICHLLRRVCEEIKILRKVPEELTMDYQDLQKTFERFLEIASFGKPMVLVIDGLDQLNSSYRAQALDWLPSNPGIRVIVSCESGSPPHRVLEMRNSELPQILVPQLGEKEQKEFVRKRLWEYRKKLDESPSNNQLRFMCSKQSAPIPLWLSIACEELRVFGVYEELTRKVKSLASSVPQLIASVLTRIEKEHGKEIISSALSLLYCSNGGLQEKEMLALLARSDELNFPARAWGAICRSLHGFLRVPGDVEDATYDFFHKSFASVVQTRYLMQRASIVNVHKRLAKYYFSLADPSGDASWTGATPRAISNLPYHLTQGKMWSELEMVLCDLSFCELKCLQGMTFDLVRDLFDACEEGPGSWPSGVNQMSDFHHFVSSNSHLLAKKPSLFFQLAANSSDNSSVHAAAMFMMELQNKKDSSVWVRWLNKPLDRDPCHLTLAGFHEPFMACDFSPNGDLMVSASRDRSLKIWETKSGAEVVTLIGHSNAVVDCKFSPDNRQVVSASWDRTLKVWDVETGAEVGTLSGHRRKVSACCFSHDGNYILSASWDCSLGLWPVPSAGGSDVRRRKYYKKHLKPVNACIFSPDDKMIASASWDCSIIIWETESTNVIKTLKGHDNSVRSVAFSPDGTRLVSTSIDCTVREWDVDTGMILNVMEGHSSPVNRLSFCADGRHVVSASDDRTVRIWDTVGGRAVRSMSAQSSYALYAEFFPDGNRVVSGQSDCTVVIWETLIGEKQVTMEGHTRVVNQARVSPDGKLIASVSDDGTGRLWTPNGSCLFVLKGHKGAVTSCCFSKCGKLLVTTGEDFTVKVWNTETGEEIRTLTGHDNVVRCCDVAPKRNYIATASRDNSIRLWDLQTGKQIWCVDGLYDWVNDLCFSPDGRYLISGSWDFNISMWDLVTRGKTPCAVFKGHSGAVSSCRFSLDGQKIVSSSYDGTLRIWNFHSKNEITSIPAHEQRINYCNFSHDGTLLVSCSEDRTIGVWDAIAGKEVSRLQGHSGGIESVSFHPEQNSVLSAGQDGTVRVWNVKEDQQSGLSHKDSVSECCATSDGRFVLTCSRDRTLLLWYTVNMTAIASLKKHTKGVSSCAIVSYTPGGMNSVNDTIKVVSVGDDKMIVIWEILVSRGSSATATVLKEVKGKFAFRSVAVNPSASHFYTAGLDNHLVRWQTERPSPHSVDNMRVHRDWVNAVAVDKKTGNVASVSHDMTVHTGKISTKVHENWVLDCSFSPDGRYVASASYDGTVSVVGVANGAVASVLAGHTDRVNKVRFLDDRTLLTGGADGCVFVWGWKERRLLAEFVVKGHVTALGVIGEGKFVVGDSLGNVEFLQLFPPRRF